MNLAPRHPRRILVPLDGTPGSDGILPHVYRLAHADPGHTELVLLTVLPPGAPERNAWRAAARQHLVGLRERLGKRGAGIRTRVVEGEPAAQVLEVARTLDAELVAMATHGRTGLDRWVRGSVAEQVLQESPVPVFLATPRAADVDAEVDYRRVLVPLDGPPAAGDGADELLAFAAGLARGAELVLLHIVPSGDAQAQADERLGPTLAALAAAGVKARIVGRAGEPTDAIVAAVEDGATDVLAMTTHARAGLARLRHGSVAADVLARVACPMLALRRAD